jgi:hypothetical protein
MGAFIGLVGMYLVEVHCMLNRRAKLHRKISQRMFDDFENLIGLILVLFYDLKSKLW